MDFVEERVQAFIRTECVGDSVFPPVQIVDWTGSKPEETFFVLTFEPSNEHALASYLQVWFSLRLIDHVSTGISISVAASLNMCSLPPGTASQNESVLLYEGLFDEGVVGPKLQMFLYSVLDEALAGSTIIEGAIPGPTWLNCTFSEAA